MTVNENISTVTSGQENRVTIDRLYQELHELWKPSSVKEGEESSGITRACLHNLVMYTEKEEILRTINDTIVSITNSYPCRAILLYANSDNPSSTLDAWISSHCHLEAGSNNQICCEQITIQSSGEDMQQIPSLVLPLLVADLPVTLWWRKNSGYDSKVFQQLADISNEIILQSNDYDDPNQLFKEIHKLLSYKDFDTPVIDLAWQRIQVWREIMAYLFNKPEFQNDLNDIQKVYIEFNGESKESTVYPNKVYLLMSWLITQLKWTVQSQKKISSKDIFEVKSTEGNTIPIEIHARFDETIPLKQILKFEISTGKDSQEKKYSIHWANKCNHLIIQVESSEKLIYSRKQVMKIPTDADYIGARLQMYGRDQVFEKSLQTVIQLTGFQG